MDSDPGSTASQPLFFIGLDHVSRRQPVSAESPESGLADGYDMLTTPITNQAFRDNVVDLARKHIEATRNGSSDIAMPVIPSLTPEYTSLHPDFASHSLIAFVSPWIDVASANPVVAYLSRQVLGVEIAYAAFCGISNLILPPLVHGKAIPDPAGIARYASSVVRATTIGPYLQLLMPLPMDHNQPPSSDKTETISSILNIPSHIPTAGDHLSTWDAWDQVRSATKYHPKLAIALTLPRLLPAHDIQSRWFSEPLRILNIPSTSFAPNPKGHPVLSKAHQHLVYRYMQLQQPPWLLLSGLEAPSTAKPAENKSSEPTPAEASSQGWKPVPTTPHLTYLRHLQQTQPPLPPMARFAQGYQDYLQSPLQPLADNLESVTYEVFEKDPIKYEWYERAVALALKDLHKKLQRPIILAVVGAGRGPLMTRSLRASESTGIPITPYAVEKNPNAFVVLQHRNATDPLWSNRVTIIKTDMRSWAGPLDPANADPAKIDIMVSELLGSFADNELSPECLDGAQHLLHPSHGISIPQSYTAWLTPRHCPRIHADLLHRPASDVHKRDLPYHNARACALAFTADGRGTCHGLGAYFEAVLYRPADGGAAVELSTNPASMQAKSADMVSWFPIFFPLRTPLVVPDGAEVRVVVERRTDDRKVWYTWQVSVWVEVRGVRQRTAASEVHSSVENGCLM